MQNYPVNHWLRKAMTIFTIQISIVLIAGSVALAHTNYAQEVLEREITVNLNAVELTHALTEIGKAANIKFVYSKEQLQHNERITLNVKQRKLKEILNELLQPLAIVYTLDEDHGLVMLKRTKKNNSNKSELLPREEQSNSKPDDFNYASITGTVMDGVTNQPMAGVNVIAGVVETEKGITRGTNTDAGGHYTINAENDDVLVFSFIGYKTIQTIVANRTVIDVVMEEDVQSLNEVVVNAGYWNVKEKENTGNISKVTAEAISKQPVSNPILALQGRIPGLYIQQNSGVPGSSVEIQIRGRNSLRTGGNLPFYVVDGVPFTSTSLSSSYTSEEILSGGDNPFNLINPSDIESIEVLKDGDATAIYGSRGANGVILITTKKGKSGKAKIDLNVYKGVGQVAHKMDLMNISQYLEMRDEAFANDGETPQDWDYDVNGIWDRNRSTDWQKTLIGGTAQTTNAQLSLSGGSSHTQFALSGGYYNETSVMSGDFAYTKGSGHFSLNHSSDDQRFKLAFSSSYVTDNNVLPSQDVIRDALTLPPNAPALRDENGNLNWAENTWPIFGSANPASYLLRKYSGNTGNLITNAKLSYEVTPDLRLSANIGFTSMQKNEIRRYPISSFNPAFGRTSAYGFFADGNLKTWIVEPQAEYRKSISSGMFSALIGATFQENVQQGKTLFADGFTNDELLEDVKAATSITISASDYLQYKYNALFARVNYSWKDKYILNLTGRRDGSSRFGPGNQFANFGAIGAAWIFSKEEFMSHVPLISFGKLRSSYGVTGSDQIGDYQYLDSYSATSYSYQGSGLIPSRLANPNFGWETNKKFEVAIDLGILKDRLQITVNRYHNRSSNQLVGYSLPLITGFSSVQANFPAIVQNTGWEFELHTQNIKGELFNWSSSINVTMPETKLIQFDNIQTSSYADTYIVGQSLNARYRYTTVIDEATGLYSLKDANNDGTVSRADRHLEEIGYRLYGGIHNSFSYKGIELEFLFQFVQQTAVNYMSIFQQPGATLTNQPTEVLARWRNASDNTDIQRYSQSYAGYLSYNNAVNYADNPISDASFIRLKNLSLSYSLPKQVVNKIKLDRTRIYLQAQNLITISNYVGVDPESRGALRIPPLRMITAGIQFTL